MIRSFQNKSPRIAESAFVSEAAYVVGDVRIDAEASIWPGAVIRGDFGSISIGKGSVVEDNCVIHSGSPKSHTGNVVIGVRVVIGHGAMVHSRRIGNDVLIGMNATILHDTEIGNACLVAAGCLIRQGMKIPDNSFVTGVPGKIKGSPPEILTWWTREGTRQYTELATQYKTEGL